MYLFHVDKPAATSTPKKLFGLTSPNTSQEEKWSAGKRKSGDHHVR